jgi:hypothetical protein
MKIVKPQSSKIFSCCPQAFISVFQKGLVTKLLQLQVVYYMQNLCLLISIYLF